MNTTALKSNNTTTSTDSSISISESCKSLTLAEIERLTYTIHHYSSFSTNYIPENILVDRPTDQTSRWSAYTNNPPQYLTLKLRRPAIVRKIKFGKFEKSHVCNIKKFRVYGGLEEEHMVLLLEGGLKNDNVPEVFNLRCITEDGNENLPILYVKIMPILSWGATFNFSIWYVELHGQDDPMFTGNSMKNYQALREIEIVKLCLKHFRQQGYEAAFKALQEQTQVRLEHPLVSELHRRLVVQGEFERVEELLAECVQEGFMDAYLNRQNYKYKWHLQQTQGELEPGNRGGHQLVMDTKKRLIYLYGGWDGFQDLSDLWVYDIEKNSWSLIYKHSEQFNGPTPRSCHKMVYDPLSENIFMLGRYLDNSIRTTEYIKSDFFLYDTRARTWLQICDDTSHVGGPQLVYDHQMCIDAEKRTIYVFGGKVLTPRSVSTSSSSSEPEYSGLYSYHIATNTWTQIFVDCHHPSAAQPEVQSIKSRITHCMVFHHKSRKLYIYGGQRGKEDIDDFITYDVDTQAINVLNKDPQSCNNYAACSSESKNEPPPGYTLRATIDCERDEIYIFSSLSKIKDRRDVQHIDASNSFWVYSLAANAWSRVYTYRHKTTNINAEADIKNCIDEPFPRYAHQLVYDERDKLHYLFGGNPGKSTLPQLRLDDFWILTLAKPKREEILRHCRYMIRKLYYEEMARADPYKAMQYLRTHIAAVIDHSDPEQLNNFHKLAALLFKSDEAEPIESKATKGDNVGENANDESQVNVSDEDQSQKSESDATNAPEEASMESWESTSTSMTSECANVPPHNSNSISAGGTHASHSHMSEVKNRRAFLFNKLVCLMPARLVQPQRNLSDFVVM